MSIDNRPVRVEHWVQETMESGKWVVTEPMTYDLAQSLIALEAYERPTIVFEE